MKVLYYACDNAYNYLVVRDMSRGDDDFLVVNWDLSDDEISNIVEAFEANENDTSFYAVDASNEENWISFDDLSNSMNSFYVLC